MSRDSESESKATKSVRPCGDPRTALVVEDDADTRMAMHALIEAEGYQVRFARDLAEAHRAVAEQLPHVVLCDIVLPDGNGLQLLESLDTARADFIAITGKATVDTVVKALRLGALDYLTKPVDVERLRKILAEVASHRGGLGANPGSIEEVARMGRFGPLIGRSPPMIRLFQRIQRVAPTEATVLLQGETGTGKEVVAHAIHEFSPRCNEPFIALNCGAISQNLIESELFGHEKGAFTGADRRHLGVFERAEDGTLFLDEITEMPMELQVKLLRVLESRSFHRVGGEQSLNTNARLIAATNRSPEEAIQQGKLREDLFYRLRVFPLLLPPLRARPGDVVLLAEHFVRERSRESGRRITLDKSAKTWLAEQKWPGNVRELRNLIEHAFIIADDVIDSNALRIDDGSEALAVDSAESSAPESPAAANHEIQDGGVPEVHIRVGSTIAAAEKALILATLEHVARDKAKAARMLGISLKTLYTRLAVYEATKEL